MSWSRSSSIVKVKLQAPKVNFQSEGQASKSLFKVKFQCEGQGRVPKSSSNSKVQVDRQQTAKIRQQTAKIRQQTSKIRQQTAKNRQQTASKPPTNRDTEI